MESETLSHIHLISTPDKTSGVPLLDNSVFNSFFFDVEDEKQLATIFRFVFSTENRSPFSIIINCNSEKWTNNWLDKLTLILSHPNYLKYQRKLILPVYSSCDNFNTKSILDLLSIKLKEQGFRDINIFDLKDASLKKEMPFRFYSKNKLPSDHFYECYLNDLIESESLFNIFIDVEDGKLAERFFKLKKESENRLKLQQPVMYQLIRDRQLKSLEAAEHKAIINLLGEDLSSKKAYLDFILGKFKEDQAPNANMTMKKFYHHEYEILPTWYKRFGHIIKVFMGKRTFRSLFNDDVKKYPD